MENNVLIFRMITGEDIICSYHKMDSKTYLFLDPMMMMVKFKGKDSTVLMEYWLPIEVIKSNSVVVGSEKIITSFEPKDSLKEYYLNLAEKLHVSLERIKIVENMDTEEMVEILEAMEESKGHLLH